MPPNGQRLAQRVAAEERHLGHINLRAAEHLDVQGHFTDSAGASKRRRGPDGKDATAEVRKPAWWQGRRCRSRAPPGATLRPGVSPRRAFSTKPG